jgi:hypothetical protein
MDLAYDHIQEEALSPESSSKSSAKKPDTTLNADFQEAYRAISSSPWGARLGGFFGSVVKQVTGIQYLVFLPVADSFPGRVRVQRSPK